MKSSVAALVTLAGLASALTQDCTGTVTEENGNFFCGAVEQIRYEGIKGDGSYQDVTGMGADGTCQMQDKPFSGSLAPLDEDLVLVLRGPLGLKEVAVYNLAPEKIARRDNPGGISWNKHAIDAEKNEKGDSTGDGKRGPRPPMRLTTLHRAKTHKNQEGDVDKREETSLESQDKGPVDWKSRRPMRLKTLHHIPRLDEKKEYDEKREEASLPSRDLIPGARKARNPMRLKTLHHVSTSGEEREHHEKREEPSPISRNRKSRSPMRISTLRRIQNHDEKNAHKKEKRDDTSRPKTLKSSRPSEASTAPAQRPLSEEQRTTATSTSGSSSGWSRVAYYNAEDQVADNVVFMGNYGGEGSGTFDDHFGNSIAFLNASGTGGASSPQILGDVLIPSDKEFSIFSAEKCDGDCGYSRAKDVAYKGFSGGNKIFLLEFSMPLDGKRGFNGDMPAIWALNGRILRTSQYGSCSCWATGCGEVDIFEVLAPGDAKCKSTLHVADGAGSSDYFERPTGGPIKAAVIFEEATASISIVVLPGDVDFAETLDAQTVEAWASGDNVKSSSLFQLS